MVLIYVISLLVIYKLQTQHTAAAPPPFLVRQHKAVLTATADTFAVPLKVANSDVDRLTYINPAAATVPYDVEMISKKSQEASTDALQEGEASGDPALVILCHDRPGLLEKLLERFSRFDDIGKYSVYVSLDNPLKQPEYHSVVQPYINRSMVKALWVVPDGFQRQEHDWHSKGLFKISEHFRFVLERAFDHHNHSRLILQEDDLLPANDFLLLFEKAAVLLDTDPTIWCISAWNDNAFSEIATDPGNLMRTQYFPGLGWMLKQELWKQELSHIWPKFATSK